MPTQLSVAIIGYKTINTFHTQYQSAVRLLIYTMLSKRSDITYSVSVVSCYISNPDLAHWQVVKKIFCYLHETVNLQLTYKSNLQTLTDYTNAEWAGD